MHARQRAAEHGEVLAEDIDQPAVDGAVPGDHAVPRDLLVLHAEVDRAMLDEHVVFLERAGIEQGIDALTRRQLALGMLRLDALGPATQARGRALALELFQHVLHSGTPAHYDCFRPKRKRGLDLRPLPGRANAVHLSVRRSGRAADALDHEQIVLLADTVDIEAAESAFVLHGAVEVIETVASSRLHRLEDDLDLAAAWRDDLA